MRSLLKCCENGTTNEILPAQSALLLRAGAVLQMGDALTEIFISRCRRAARARQARPPGCLHDTSRKVLLVKENKGGRGAQ